MLLSPVASIYSVSNPEFVGTGVLANEWQAKRLDGTCALKFSRYRFAAIWTMHAAQIKNNINNISS
jgi:hypothetical protein